MATLVNVVANSVGIQQIVDVGSGVGHLSRVLSYAHELKTVSIDAKESHVESAKTFDDQLVKQLRKNTTKESEEKQENLYASNIVPSIGATDSKVSPFHLAQYVDFNDKTTFIDTLSPYFKGMNSKYYTE